MRGPWFRASVDAGSGTVLGAGIVVALLVITMLGVQLGAATITRHRVETAADLAALAGAGVTVAGEPAACGQARRVTVPMRVQLVSCRVHGWDVLVRVSADPPGPLGRFGTAQASARAGPVSRPGTVS